MRHGNARCKSGRSMERVTTTSSEEEDDNDDAIMSPLGKRMV